MQDNFKTFRLNDLRKRLLTITKRFNYFANLLDEIQNMVDEYKETSKRVTILTDEIVKLNNRYQEETNETLSDEIWVKLSDMNESYTIDNETLEGIKIELFNIMIDHLHDPIKEDPNDYEEIDEIATECSNCIKDKQTEVEHELAEIKQRIEEIEKEVKEFNDEQFPELINEHKDENEHKEENEHKKENDENIKDN